MRILFLFVLTAICVPTSGQDARTTSLMADYLAPDLRAAQSVAHDSIVHYRRLEEESMAAGQQLLGGDGFSRFALGYSVPAVYEAQYGSEMTAKLVRLMKKWELSRKRHMRWENLYARIRELSIKIGQKEIYSTYGSKTLSLLENEKKRSELIHRELIRGALFFHMWQEGVSEYSLSRSGGGRIYKSINKVEEAIRDFSFRGPMPVYQESVTAGGAIPAKNLLFSYPQNQQANFYPDENIRVMGAVVLRNYYNSGLSEASRTGMLWARWKSAAGKVLYTRAVFSGKQINYRIPRDFLNAREVYQLAIVKSKNDIYDEVLDFYAKKEISQLINQGIYHREKKEVVPEETYFKAYFRVSSYGRFLGKTMRQKFTPLEGPGMAYRFRAEEPFGPEEVAGLHGMPTQAYFSYYGCPEPESILDKIYGAAARTFYAHPTQEYVDYLKRNKEQLNLDSLIAIEFLPYKERVSKYRRLTYTDVDGKRLRVTSKKLPLPAKPNHRSHIYASAEVQPITETIFKNPTLYKMTAGELILRDTFPEAVQRIALDIAPVFEERAEEYADLLRELNALSPQVPAGTDFSTLVKEINALYVTDPYNENMVGLKTCFPEKINIGYSLPMRAMATTSGRMELEKKKK